VGTEIASVSVDGLPIDQITMTQYAELSDVTTAGSPTLWATDGLSNVYLVPVANGQTIEVLHRTTATSFADTTTSYTMPPGYKAALGISLACSLAPIINPSMLAALKMEERSAMSGIQAFKPEILDTYSYNASASRGNILNGWT